MAVRKTKKGLALKRWFKEDWKDVKTGKACGRKKGDKRGTPYCRPTKRVSSKTPKTSGEMTAAQKKKRIAQKKRLGQPAGKPRRVSALRRQEEENIMATSGTTTFNLDLNNLVEEAFERCGAEMRTGYDLRTARRS